MSKVPPPSIKSARPITLVHELPISKTANFWEGLKQGKLLTTRCRKCGGVSFPPAGDCAKCLSSDVEWVELSGEAQLETYTEITIPPASFARYGQYLVAIGKLKEGVKVLAWLTGVKRESVKVGMNLKLTAKVTPEGRATYEFVPA
jgi:uncharacterized OB-fold protein